MTTEVETVGTDNTEVLYVSSQVALDFDCRSW